MTPTNPDVKELTPTVTLTTPKPTIVTPTDPDVHKVTPMPRKMTTTPNLQL